MGRFEIAVFLIKFLFVAAVLSSAIFRVHSFSPQYSTFKVESMTQRHVTAGQHLPEFNPSQTVVDTSTGEKWRLCAGVAILNSKNQILVAERADRPGQWQCPQGGVDEEPKKETVVEAAIRELYEETGLVLGRHVMLEDNTTSSAKSNDGVRYVVSGSDNWLTKAGFAGQELHWVFFRCVDGQGDLDPVQMCDLSGKGGEKAEFSKVTWKDIDAVIENIWEGKRAPYHALRSKIKEVYDPLWQTNLNRLDFSGRWSRDKTLSTDLVAGLEGRGLTRKQAEIEADKSYTQLWEQNTDTAASWLVTTYADDDATPRRSLIYQPGTWEETYQGKSNLFGECQEPFQLIRRTSYVGEEDASPIPIAQVTITNGPKGIEESRRYRRQDKFVLRRTLWPISAPDAPIISTEVFTHQAA